jgi:hypothetical protein
VADSSSYVTGRPNFLAFQGSYHGLEVRNLVEGGGLAVVLMLTRMAEKKALVSSCGEVSSHERQWLE